MKNNKEHTLKLIISTLFVIISMLVIILVILIPEESEHINEYSDPVASSEENTASDTQYDSTESVNKTTEKNTIPVEISDIASATHPVEEEKLLQKKSRIIENRTKSIVKKKEKKLYFIIDDAGYNINQLKPFLEFPGKITIAVLPGLPRSADCARMINASGKQVFLHQPMEAFGKNNPGPGAIMLGMNESEIKEILVSNLDSLPFVSGFNNHMGSAVTSEPDMVETILKTAKQKQIIFTDSFTTSHSKCKEVSEKLGIAIAKRDVFLDNVDNREAIMESMNTGLNIAENKGHAVMIGHVWSSELADTMMEIYPNLIEDGFTLEEMSDLILGDM